MEPPANPSATRSGRHGDLTSEKQSCVNAAGLLMRRDISDVDPTVATHMNHSNSHVPHPRSKERSKTGPHLIENEHAGFNGWLAVLITGAVSTMWCAYVFAAIALISLPAAIQGGTAATVSWIAQTFLQLVLLSVIMVGQKVAARASDKQALQTYKDAEALLVIQDDLHKLLKINNELTVDIHRLAMLNQGPATDSE